MLSFAMMIKKHMVLQEILALYDEEQRREVVYPGLRKEIGVNTVRFVGKPSLDGGNFVLHSQLNAQNAAVAIEAEIAYFDGIGHPFEWKVYDHDTPSDLRQRLLDRGFKADGRGAIMVLDLANVPQVLSKPDTAVTLRRLTQPEQLKDLIDVLSQVYPDKNHDFLNELLAADLRKRPDYCSVWVAYVDGQPASCGWANFHPNSQFASLWAGSTVAQYRKMGLYTAVTVARVQEAIQRGYRFITIDASLMNEPIAASRGFQLLTYAHACMWSGKA